MFLQKLSNRVQIYNSKFKNTTKCLVYRCCSSKPLVNISDPAVIKYLEYAKTEYWDLKTKHDLTRQQYDKLRSYFPLIKVLEERSCIVDNLKNLDDLDNEGDKDKDMAELLKEERDTYESILKQLDKSILEAIFAQDTKYSYADIILEITAGVGGQEAMLFTTEMFNMYLGFADYHKWDYQITHMEKSDIGGIKKVCINLSGQGTYDLLKLEGGVHRVQRIPTTEKGGRLHTSTASVAVLLQPTDIELIIPDRDLRIETKRASGAGGQHVNTTDSAVRVTHIPTGISVDCQMERDQHQNKKVALARVRAILYQQQLDKQGMEEKANRKAQVGSGLRNEKIRTYNYNQDRVTDHRLGASAGSVHGLATLMEGGDTLNELILKLRQNIRIQTVLHEINSFNG